MTDLITPTGVLVMTAQEMAANREKWLTARRGGRGQYNIGSSDVPSILDLDGVGTPVHVYRNKVLGVRMPVTEQMEMGHEAEPFISNRWTRINRTVTDEIGLVAREGARHHVSTIDRRVRECPLEKGLTDGCGLEVKNVGYSSASRWNRELPDRILAQVIHQLYVTGYPHMHVAMWIGGNQPKQLVVYADRERELMDYIVAEVDRFREQHLIAEVEPEWSLSKAEKLIALDTATHPTRVGETSVEEIGIVMEYAELAARAGAIDRKMKRLKAELRRIADGAEVVLFSDELAYSYRPGTHTSTNLDKLAERYPAAYADPEIVISKPTHTLVIDRAYKVKATEEP